MYRWPLFALSYVNGSFDFCKMLSILVLTWRQGRRLPYGMWAYVGCVPHVALGCVVLFGAEIISVWECLQFIAAFATQ